MANVIDEVLEEKLTTYLDALRASQGQELYIERRFAALEESVQLPTEEAFRYRGALRENEPLLDDVISKQRLVLLGEPGAGKSTVVREAVRRLASRGRHTEVPIVAQLRAFRGDMATLLLSTVPPEILDSPVLGRVYILDGIDEIPREYLQAFADSLRTLFQKDPEARLLATARQAFFAEHKASVPRPASILHILDFEEEDIRTYSETYGVDADDFQNEVFRVDCSIEVRNPFVLKVMASNFRDLGRLSPTKSDNVSLMIDRLIASRATLNRVRQRRAIRMLAVAMETYSRNELTSVEANRTLTIAMAIEAEQAAIIIDELLQSILVRTSDGIAFQMRSYGEFLAAEELASQSVDRLRELAFLPNGHPNESWLNTISYLVEINDEIRAYFLRRYPSWMLSSSPAAFSEIEKEKLVEKTLATLEENADYVVSHPTIKPRLVTRFLTEKTIAQLIDRLTSPRPDVSGNALVLLALAGQKRVVDVALPLAIDTKRADLQRYSAIVALINVGTPELVDKMLPSLDRMDPDYINVVDCLGAIMGDRDIPRVLPVILSTDAMLSATYNHFRELRSRTAVKSVLEYFIKNPDEITSIRADGYVRPVLNHIGRVWDEEIAGLCADLLVSIEKHHVFDQGQGIARRFFDALRSTGRTADICNRVLSRFMVEGTEPICVDRLLAGWLDEAAVQMLIGSGRTDLIQRLALYLPPGGFRSALAPYSKGTIEAQDRARRQWDDEERQRQQAERESVESAQQQIATQIDVNPVLNAFARLKQEFWPDLCNDRIIWLSDKVGALLRELDLDTRIVYSDDNSWSQPALLPLLLKVIERYDLNIANDEALVSALRAAPGDIIANYYKRRGLSLEGIRKLHELIGNQNLNSSITSHVLSFIDDTEFDSEQVVAGVIRVANDDGMESYVRRRALDILGKRNVSDALILEFLTSRNREVSQRAFSLLVERNDQPTIERALAELLRDKDKIRANDVQFPDISPLAWIAKISARFAWKKLVALRRQALQLSLPSIVDLCTEALARIDSGAVAMVIRQQVPDAPESWQRSQRGLAIQVERNSRLQAVRDTPFELVIQKLKGATSIILLKVWCEGPSDRGALRAFLGDLGEIELAKTMDFVGGWPNLLAEKEPERWLDGCREAVIIMDGDSGRALSTPAKPLTDLGRKAAKQLSGLPIRLYVLTRFGIENYFSRPACEAVLGRDLTKYFPIPENVPIQQHFSTISPEGIRSTFYKKEWNGDVAERMNISELEGTDLRDILKELHNIAADDD
jgi:hypothetical protein